jgi:transcriptional repressor NrdR
MKCPFCQHPESKVIDSRLSVESNITRRRRECEKCAKRFTTYERVEEILPMIVKKDGRRDPFDRMKLLHGIQASCEKRPVSVDVINKLVDEIVDVLQEKGDKEITSREVGELVMRRLKGIDEVAYVRFASVYRSFRDVNEFINEVERVLKK